MNEEEIIEKVMQHVKYMKNAIAEPGSPADALFGLWNLYNQEKEKNKKLEEEVKQFSNSYAEMKIEDCDTYFMLNRIINLMAEDLKRNADIIFDKNMDIKNIKKYYALKARGE